MRSRIFLIFMVLFSFLFILGCSHLEFAPKDRIWYYHKELPEADRAIEAAREAGKDVQCPVEFQEASDLRDKAYETYQQYCGTQEGIAMAVEARAMAEALCPGKPKPGVIARMTLHIHFDTDKAVIKEEDRTRMNEAVDFINKYPKAKIVIDGHTDSVGDEEYNLGLSHRRAQAAKQYFVEEGGIKASRMTVRGHGELRPVQSNDTAWGKSQNRRVEILITE